MIVILLSSERDNPSWIKTTGFPSFFYNGDCNDPNVQMQLKIQFKQFLSMPFIPPPFCAKNPQCTHDIIKIHCGEPDAAEKRRRRRNTKKVSFYCACLAAILKVRWLGLDPEYHDNSGNLFCVSSQHTDTSTHS